MKEQDKNIVPLSEKDRQEWARVKELQQRPSVRAKLRKFEAEIREEELAKDRQMADIASMAAALRAGKGKD